MSSFNYEYGDVRPDGAILSRADGSGIWLESGDVWVTVNQAEKAAMFGWRIDTNRIPKSELFEPNVLLVCIQREAPMAGRKDAYFGALCEAMEMLGQDPRTIFMGQAVEYPGTGMSNTLRSVPVGKLLELPVAEDFQLGLAIGMSLDGFIPICIYPRVNFLLLAMSQLVLHLDKIEQYSAYKPKVIVRTAVATPIPLDPGPQHLGDYTVALRMLLERVQVIRLDGPEYIVSAYRHALEREGSTLLIERTELYA